MPGFAFHLETLGLVAPKLSAADTLLLQSHGEYASLGAFGPDILLYTPPSQQLATDLASGAIITLIKQLESDPGSLSTQQKQELEELYRKPFGAAYSALFSQLVTPIWPALSIVTSFLADATTIAQSEDKSKLPGLFSQLTTVKPALTTLQTDLWPAIKSLYQLLPRLIELGPWMEEHPALLPDVALAADQRACRTYEFLRWHRSGKFAEALMAAADSPAKRAFALGWLTHIAASVTAEPFVNNIVGGPYRIHWWRNRLAQNYIDSWTYGYVNSSITMTGDEPSQPYPTWAPLCAANLQEEFNVGSGLAGAATGALPDAVTAMATGVLGALPQTFPPEIASLLTTAIEATYSNSSYPEPFSPPALSSDTFAQAYVGAYAVFWFLTSADGPIANNVAPTAPGNCAAQTPTWLQPSSTASPPQQSGSNSGSEGCEIVLAILAVLSFLTGNIAAGVGFVIAALEEAPSIDWSEVQCTVYWITDVFFQLENLLRDALVLSALAYPPPILLGGTNSDSATQPATDFTNITSGSTSDLTQYESLLAGIPLTRTNSNSADRETYPRRLDEGILIKADLRYLAYPQTDVEGEATDNLIPADKYPDYVLDNFGAAATNILDAGPYPTGGTLFGDAVSNAVALIGAGAGKLADYNLDGDRGYGWQGWHPELLSQPASPPVDPVQDA